MFPPITLAGAVAALSTVGAASRSGQGQQHALRAVAIDRPALDDFVSKEKAIALQGVLNNIGPHGSQVPGAGAGVVVASPSRANPDYYYTWTRDSALTFKVLVDELLTGNNDRLQDYVEEYIKSQAVIQTLSNPSGTLLGGGLGLAEAKFTVQPTRFNGEWGRPQRDGPALRAITLITYSNWLAKHGQTDKAKTVVWPIISNDLSYVGQYWNETGFDIWEEVKGSGFFTTLSQYRSLVEGAKLAQTLGVTCVGCDQAPQVLCFLQSYWNGAYIAANVNNAPGRSGKGSDTIIASIHAFDVNAPCDSPTFQPCHPKALSNFKAVIDDFRDPKLYPINSDIPKDSGVAIGRYKEDVYMQGNPWYLTTLAAAEFLYDVVAQWKQHKAIAVDSISLPFLQDLYASASAKTYKDGEDDFEKIIDTVTKYADSFLAIVQKYTPANGALSEQFNKTKPGEPGSARDLTWSYSAFVSAAQRRIGQFPPAWHDYQAQVPAKCAKSADKGEYAPATAAGAAKVTDGCAPKVRFEVNVTTIPGEEVYVVGDTASLGGWEVKNGIKLSGANYSQTRPLWFADAVLVGGEKASYSFVKFQDCARGPVFGTVNHTVVVPGCDKYLDPDTPVLTTDDKWEGPQTGPGPCPEAAKGGPPSPSPPPPPPAEAAVAAKTAAKRSSTSGMGSGAFGLV